MSEVTENTFGSYLGPEFQDKLIWQLLTDIEFAEKIIEHIHSEYFDNQTLRKLITILQNYYKEFNRIPNILNNSVEGAIFKYRNQTNPIESEQLFSIVKRITEWNELVTTGQKQYDGDAIQKETFGFIKQQEYRLLSEFIQSKVKSGGIRDKNIFGLLDARINKINIIGDIEDQGTSVIEGIEHALRDEFRETVTTGIEVIDKLTDGGLGKGEIGIILTPTGTGKTTMLTKIANAGWMAGKNILQIIFEDTEDQIKRKHYTIMSGVALSDINGRSKYVREKCEEMVKNLNGGRIIIKKFSQEDTTILTIRNWMIQYEKKNGFKFDELILDYLDCVESHKKTTDRGEAELVIVKSFLALASDFNIPAWSALQSNREGTKTKIVGYADMGGSFKRAQKAHFFMSVTKKSDSQNANNTLATVKILKSRFAKDGQLFEDSTFDNDNMIITLNDSEHGYKYSGGKKPFKNEEKLLINDYIDSREDKSITGDIIYKMNHPAPDLDEILEDPPTPPPYIAVAILPETPIYKETAGEIADIIAKTKPKAEDIVEIIPIVEEKIKIERKKCDIVEILRLYSEGLPNDEIASLVNTTTNHIGVKLSNYFKNHPEIKEECKNKRTLNKKNVFNVDEILKLFIEGNSHKNIAKIIGCSEQTIYKYLKDYFKNNPELKDNIKKQNNLNKKEIMSQPIEKSPIITNFDDNDLEVPE